MEKNMQLSVTGQLANTGDYEALRQYNIDKNNEFLTSIGLSSSRSRVTVKSALKKRKSDVAENEFEKSVDQRRSSRLARRDPINYTVSTFSVR
jgi:hypothetical protein